MLSSINQISPIILPSVDTKLNRQNIIKKSLLLDYDIQLYLPTVVFKPKKKKEIFSSFEQERIKNTHQTQATDNNLSPISDHINYTEANSPFKQKEMLQECNSKDYLLVKTKFLAVQDKFKHFKDEIPLPMEGRPEFNLKELTKKVREITKSVKLNLRSKEQIALKYRLHCIANKKDSSSVEDFLRLEKSIDNMNLLKVILNVEYDNIFNGEKKARHSTVKKGISSSYAKALEEYRRMQREIELKEIHRKSNKSKSSSKRKGSRSNTGKQTELSDQNEGSVLITEVDKKKKDVFRFDQKYYFDKYQKCLSNFLIEEKTHQNKMVFTSNEISNIMKSKKAIVLDGLKKDYVHKFNQNVELAMKIEQKGGELFREIELKHREQQQRRVGNKINQAFVFNEEGNINSMRNQIKDHIKGCDFDFYNY